MKPTLGVLSLFLLLSVVAEVAGQDDTRKDKVLAARKAWYEAFCKGDTATMEKVEDKDFVIVSEAKVITKEKQLADIRKAVDGKKWLPAGAMEVAEDLKVRFYGNVALVSGRSWIKMKGREAPPKSLAALTEVWVEQDGKWNIVHMHFHTP
jgi:ketosteroid isomerase-like protein